MRRLLTPAFNAVIIVVLLLATLFLASGAQLTSERPGTNDERLTTNDESAIVPDTLADTWTYPLKPWDDFKVTQSHGHSSHRPGYYHPGIDVEKKSGSSEYLPVYAAANGVVSYVCNSTMPVVDCQGFGKAVLVSHTLPASRALPDGTTRVTSIYGHLQVADWLPIVSVGTHVTKGETIIGYLADADHDDDDGQTSSGPHLHFGVRRGHFDDTEFPKSLFQKSLDSIIVSTDTI